MKLIGRSALADRNCSEPIQPGLPTAVSPYPVPSPQSQGAGGPSLTVLKAQDDIPQVEACLLLWEGLVARYLHDWPMGTEGKRDFQLNLVE